MQITSNDSIALQELYTTLKRERIDATLNEKQVEGAMGIIPTIEIKSSDFTTMIKEMFIAWLEYKKFKLYVDNQEISKEEFDKLNEDSKIEVKFDER
ncbi:MAG: hypothetical protein U9N49_12995 [Campylobacterota bacterium]|nr:hypothetical protein [Campylobacterota bacterium]